MLVRRFNGNPIQRLRHEMDHLFDNFFHDVPSFRDARRFPALNIWDDESHCYVEAELPGVNMEDVELLVSGSELTLKGERKDQTDDKVVFHRKERSVGRFSRVVQMPVSIEADKVTATLVNGVLLITLPKAAEVRPRKIDVKSLSK